MAERRNHLILVGLIAIALIGAALLALPASPFHRAPVLGLDLQGGLEVVLEAKPPPGRQLQDADIDRSLEIIRDRVDRLGVAEPTITKQGTDQISVELPGVPNADRARELIGQTATLELYDLETSLVGPSINAQLFPVEQTSLYDLLASAATQSIRQRNGDGDRVYLFERESKTIVVGPLPSRSAVRETDGFQRLAEDGDKVPEGHVILSVPAETVVITCDTQEVVCPGIGPPTQTYYYLFRHAPNAEEPIPQMTGEDLRLSGTRHDIDPQQGPIVLMEFTDAGADKFEDVTRDEYIRGRAQYTRFGQGQPEENFYQHFAIVLDRQIRSFPSINFNDPQLSGGIGGGSAQITGIASVEEARDLAVVLQTGALPVEFVTLSTTDISATLGEDSLREALRAAIVGLVVVALFLLIAYRFLGLVAVLGLAIYGTLLYAVILLFNVTLTLPGFAGMILTIGVAADANIVIFERIKEESRAGKSVRAAISAGYAKGFNSIIDANVITAMTAVVLFVLATAGVRGFALMLLIGTAMSVGTAVFATRAMLGLLAGFRWFNSPAFMGASGTQIASWIQHDYVGKRRIWFALSIAVVVISVAALGVRGLNFGIDFEGGTELSFTTTEPTLVEDVRAEAEKVGQGNAGIRGVGEAENDRYTEFQVQTEALDQEEQTALRTNLRQAVSAEDFNLTTVSASFGSQLARSAIQAIVFSLLLVILWISFRFQWKFALATIIALIHDLLIAIGIYAFSGKEVTTASVAAILTVLGYSMYDSIIILDRVRENIPLMRRASMRTIGNVSLWETIRRSLATTFITLLPITALYFFGGETLKDFAFAILVGIGSGAYSSIFLAVPLVAWLKEREPEYERRRDDGAPTKEEAEQIVEEATAAAADAPVPELAPLTPAERAATNQAKRERRRQRRRTRPHGRAR